MAGLDFMGIRPDWHRQAACSGVDPDLWFPERGTSQGRARQICATCPARVPCLEEALAHEPRYGIWGGTSYRDRVLIRAQRETAA